MGPRGRPWCAARVGSAEEGGPRGGGGVGGGSAGRAPAGASERYKAGLRLGGSKPLPQLFNAAGLDFDFSSPAVARTWSGVEQALAELPV